MKIKQLLATILAVVAIQDAVRADQATASPNSIQKLAEENREMRERLDRQQALIEQLTEKIRSLDSADQRLARDLDVITSVHAADELPTQPSGGAADQEGLRVPSIELRGFGDVTYTLGGGDPNQFTTDGLVLFISSTLSENFSVFSEVMFEIEEDGEVELDVERLELRWSASDLLNVLAGRSHTAFGYWNQAFHHGTWLQTTVSRPEMYQFEHDGSIIPMHFMGIRIFGGKHLNRFSWKYDVGLGNGRGRTWDEVQTAEDANDSKAINVSLGVEPRFFEGLHVGASVYWDKIPPDRDNPVRDGDIDEIIYGGYLVYLKSALEFMAEAASIRHDDEVSGRTFDTLALYVQAAYQLGQWKPYYRFDFIDFTEGDPFYAPNDRDIAKHTLGLRWDPITWLGLKLEYGYTDQMNSNRRHSLALQSAFTF